jgi:hypothetical protein
MRENRLYGSEGGAARAVPTPIMLLFAMDSSFRWNDENRLVQSFPK